MSPLIEPTVLLAVVEAQSAIGAADLDLDAVLRLACARAEELTGADGALVELTEAEELVCHAGSGGAIELVGQRLPRAASLSGQCVVEGRAKTCDDATSDPRVDAALSARVGVVSVLCVPLVDRGGPIGTLKVVSGHRAAFGPGDEAALSLLSSMIAAQMRHAQVYAAAEAATREDRLTGLGNARSYRERVDAEVARGIRHGRPVTLCLVELDGVPALAADHGERAVDEAVLRVARALCAVRACDQAFRIGPHTFALLLPETTEAEADAALRRLHATLAVRDASGRPLAVATARKQARHRDPDRLEAAVRETLERSRATTHRLPPVA